MKILMVGPFKDFSGYAHIGRNLAMGLKTAGADIALRNIKYDDYDQLTLSPEEEEMYRNPIRDCDIVLQMTTPNEIRYIPNKMNIAMIFWETTRIPKYWVDQLNLMDLIIAPCRFNAMVLTQCGVTKPICVSHPVFDMQTYNKHYPLFDIPNIGNKTLFYNICQLSAKKGIDVLLKSFFRAFADIPDEAMLVLKTYISMQNRHNEIEHVKSIINKIKGGMRMPIEKWPQVYIITSIFNDEDIYRLHKTCHAYVCSSRGEGWGIPPFEALAMGTPLISHNWSSLGDFVTEKNSILYGGQAGIVFDQAHVDPYLYTGFEEWFDPNSYQLMTAMRSFHEVRMGRSGGKITKEDIEARSKQGKEDLRQFDIREGGPKIYSELKRSLDAWKQHGIVTQEKKDEVTKT